MAFTLTDVQQAALLEALGLPADTTDPELVVDTVTDLVAQAEALDPAKPSTVAAAAKKAGMELLDKDAANALRRDAAEGRKMAAAAAQERIAASVDDAIRKGKITPGRRKHWVNLISADPEMADVLAKVPDETAAPMSETGHSMNPEPGSDLAEPGEWFY
ncbi:hypothetical protein MPRF_38960 [Mycolicibacterium parafortuitum]|uniref:Mu-like prophage I protein n=1 Tax=Mycolicibacterium parafortuitum TaxID=39692 RepID=A0A7I7U6R0_MYCPF|nr:phage protease [Mycolicibacterium parafortuitum]BBY76997.1 hypothetical protein MPRF_38960 [Mycolicibacterium parafortuitum]